MSAWLLTWRSLSHHWRTNVGVVLGVACAVAVLVGALSVGDSVRLSLRDQALQRIGRVESALVAGDRFVRAALADEVARELDGATCVPVVHLPGVATSSGGAVRTGIVEVFGVGRRYFGLSTRGAEREPIAAGRALLNGRLARQLRVDAGDEIVVRIERPGPIPREAAMATVDDVSFALRVTVDGVLDDEEFGRFGLQASQVPPFNLFVSLAWIQAQLELPERANMLLVDDGADTANAALRANWSLADAELQVRALDGGVCELTSERVFIDPPVVDAVRDMDGGLVGVSTYFVNAMRVREAVTPYSTISGIGPLVDGAASPAPLEPIRGLVPDPVGPDEIVLNEWAASDLGAGPKDEVRLDYFVMGRELRLEERSHTLRVHSVVPLSGAAADPGLMPDFPGLADARSCRDWEPGIPIDLERLDDDDQAYWDEHRGTPKAFVQLATARALWSNRFGSLTAVRAPVEMATRLERELPRRVSPEEVGLQFLDLRGPALAAGAPATDFGGLFLGLSFFLIVSALLLTAMLFAFGVEQRASGIGALLALGFRPAAVRGLFVREAIVLAALGAIPGVVLGVAYTHVVLGGLGSLWRGAVGQTSLAVHVVPSSVAIGAGAAMAASLAAIAFALRHAVRRPAVELLRGDRSAPSVSGPVGGRAASVVAIGALVVAALLILLAGASAEQVAVAFFGAGALLLVSALLACRRALARLGAGAGGVITSVAALGLRNAARRPGRSLATISLLASGTFLVVAVQAHRLHPPPDRTVRSSGTGGFALFGRSTLPVLRDLDTAAGRDAYGLDGQALAGVRIVPFRVHEGDDASCLNLSRPQSPRLVGVDPAALAERGAFRFVETEEADGEDPWMLLDADRPDGAVPAVGDAASVTWSLHASVGDSLHYTDESGRELEVRIVGTIADSILQGSLVVAERHLLERFPSTSGFRMFLVDAPKEQVEAAAAELSRAFRDIGMELTSTADRLAAFQAVQNTYLSIFGVLGGLGLLLGTVGLGAVVLRNALERRSELAIARAVGFPARAVRRLVWIEHVALLALGVAAGVVAAALAIQPSVGGPRPLSVFPMIGMILAVTLSGVLWVWLASVLATRGPLLDALRSE